MSQFSYNGATITVRARIGRDALWFYPLLVDTVIGLCALRDQPVPDDFKDLGLELSDISWFTEAIQQSSVEGTLSFEWPAYGSAVSTPDQLAAAYDALMNGPYDLVEQWRKALQNTTPAIDPKESPATRKSSTKPSTPSEDV